MSKVERKEKNDLLCKFIKANLILSGYKKDELATHLSMSPATLYNRLRSPDDFSRREMQVIFRKLNFTPDQMLAVM
jgi:AraC-like DNA-binding protein